MTLATGTRLELVSPLGAGGMAVSFAGMPGKESRLTLSAAELDQY